ncbi:MAG: hypothetical protein EZS28_020453 [Streblomastix strix]|uniref:Uncharacterized protein n=1 Tax=Streblomastix strix TaxID=222440 RepID=A0A5J4VP04_9EUKA|nr:MAG: hypothetical protein EZS28_020453 [Streblomastix strix]
MIQEFASTVDFTKLLNAKRLQLPLRFESERDELNILAVYSLLQPTNIDIGGIEEEFDENINNIMISGLIKAHLQSQMWNSQSMQKITNRDICDLFNLKEYQMQTKEIEEFPGEFEERRIQTNQFYLTQSIRKKLFDAGIELKKEGKVDFMDLFTSILAEGGIFEQQLAKKIPSFVDLYEDEQSEENQENKKDELKNAEIDAIMLPRVFLVMDLIQHRFPHIFNFEEMKQIHQFSQQLLIELRRSFEIKKQQIANDVEEQKEKQIIIELQDQTNDDEDDELENDNNELKLQKLLSHETQEIDGFNVWRYIEEHRRISKS